MHNVFISKRNALNGELAVFWAELRTLMTERQLKGPGLGRNEFPKLNSPERGQGDRGQVRWHSRIGIPAD